MIFDIMIFDKYMNYFEDKNREEIGCISKAAQCKYQILLKAFMNILHLHCFVTRKLISLLEHKKWKVNTVHRFQFYFIHCMKAMVYETMINHRLLFSESNLTQSMATLLHNVRELCRNGHIQYPYFIFLSYIREAIYTAILQTSRLFCPDSF